MCLTKHLKDSGCHKNSWKSLGKLGNIIASPEVGEWKYTNEITVLYKKEAYMERNRQFHLSGRLWRPGRRCLQNKNSHFSKCVSHLQRQMRKDQKRNSEEEAGILRRSRWISSNQQKFRWLEGQTRFLYNFRENLLEKDKMKKGRRKGGKKTKSFCSNWHKYFLKSTCFQQFHLCSYLQQFELV